MKQSARILFSTLSLAASAFALSTTLGLAQTPDTCVTGVDMATLGPKGIVGQGPHGEKAASPDELKLTDDEAAKVKAGKFKVGISMQTVNLDWSQLQIQGITDTLKKYGVTVTGVASAEYQVDKQIADIEHDPAASGRHHFDSGRFHRDRADLQEDRQSRHQARADGQHPDWSEASRGICDDGLGR